MVLLFLGVGGYSGGLVSLWLYSRRGSSSKLGILLIAVLLTLGSACLVGALIFAQAYGGLVAD